MTIFLFLSSNNDDKILQVMHNFFLFQEIPPPSKSIEVFVSPVHYVKRINGWTD